jgi:hypothetical protein
VKQKRTWTYVASVALVAAAVVSFVACNKGILDTAGPSSVAIPATAPAASGSGGGIQVTTVSSDFNPDRCTELNLPPYDVLTELTHVSRVTNGPQANHDAYAKCALFFSETATCGAHADNPASEETLATLMNAPNVPPGQTADWAFRLALAEMFGDDACGSWQYDCQAKNGDVSEFMLGKVINTGRNCPNCDDANVRFDVRVLDSTTGKVKITAQWRDTPYQGTLYKLKLSVDGHQLTDTSKPGFERVHESPFERVITFGGNSGGHLIEWKIMVGNEDLPGCVGEERVRFEDQPDCVDANVQLRKVTVDSTRPELYNVCFEGSWVNPGTGVLAYGDGASDGVPNPFGPQCHGYARTGSERTFMSTLTVNRNDLQCRASVEVRVPPTEETCDTAPPNITGDILGTPTDTNITFTRNTVGPPGGTFSPPLPQTVSRPPAGSPAGSFSTTYTVRYGTPDRCVVSKTFTKPVPPQEDRCEASGTPGPNPYKVGSPIGNPASECSLFGLVSIGKDEYGEGVGDTVTASMNATAAICKDGKYEGQFWYYWYLGVSSGQSLLCAPGGKDTSHLTYCGCP